MEIKLLKYLSQTRTLKELASYLKSTPLEILALIGGINQNANNIIDYNASGFRLKYALDWLDYDYLRSQLSSSELFSGDRFSLMVLDKINSTNSYALNNLDSLSLPTIITTEWQYAGRGRSNRVWNSTIAQNLTVSIAYKFDLNFNIQLLPLVSAIGLNRVFRSQGLNTKIKWPNDIWLAQEKVSGILVENVLRGQYNYTVIGIGLNNISNLKRNYLLINLIKHLTQVIYEFTILGFDLLHQEWLDNCLHYQKEVVILQEGEVIYQGVHMGLGLNGEIIIKNNHQTKSFNSNQISLRLAKQF